MTTKHIAMASETHRVDVGIVRGRADGLARWIEDVTRGVTAKITWLQSSAATQASVFVTTTAVVEWTEEVGAGTEDQR